MNLVGLVFIIVGLLYLIYSQISKNRINIYIKNDKYIIVKEKEFYKLQRILMIINSICIIAFGIIVIIFNLSNIYVVAYPLLFHTLNYTTILISLKKQYIKYKSD